MTLSLSLSLSLDSLDLEDRTIAWNRISTRFSTLRNAVVLATRRLPIISSESSLDAIESFAPADRRVNTMKQKSRVPHLDYVV